MAIAWVDTRPYWDDTGVTAGALMIAGALGSLTGIPPWLVALFVGAPLLIAELPGSAAVLLAIPFTLAGAYAGAFVRRRIVRA